MPGAHLLNAERRFLSHDHRYNPDDGSSGGGAVRRSQRERTLFCEREGVTLRPVMLPKQLCRDCSNIDLSKGSIMTAEIQSSFRNLRTERGVVVCDCKISING